MDNIVSSLSINDDYEFWFYALFQEAIKGEDSPEEKVDEIAQKVAEAISSMITSSGQSVLGELQLQASKMLRERRSHAQGFQSRLMEVWGTALDLLEMFSVIALEAGQEFNSRNREKASKDGEFLFDALTRLHARACLITSEILVLLKSGHSSGAYSRWRTLHEIAVTAFFLAENGKDVAERYLLHDAIESYKAAHQYNQKYMENKDAFEAKGYKPIEKAELQQIASLRDKLVSRFGNNYKNQYGWASNILKKDDPSFADIEQTTGFTVSRPFYRLASHAVHAQSKGLYFDLGMKPLEHDKVMLAGPSHFGLADPGQSTAYSLFQVTQVLLNTKPTLMDLIIVSLMGQLLGTIQEAFINAHEKVETDRSKS